MLSAKMIVRFLNWRAFPVIHGRNCQMPNVLWRRTYDWTPLSAATLLDVEANERTAVNLAEGATDRGVTVPPDVSLLVIGAAQLAPTPTQRRN
jgi:hypothetical protein